MPSSTFAYTSGDGQRITAYRWDPSGPPRAALQVTHGMGEHALRYGKFAEAMNERGLAPAVLLGDGPGDAARVLDQAEQHFLLATAAEAAGGIAWCLDASVGYAKEREQFGRPIGSFQAIAHQCADMLADLQSATAASRYAAVASAQGTADDALATRVAALRAAESYRRVAETAIHVLGGVGSLGTRRSPVLPARLVSPAAVGSPQEHRASIADLSRPVGVAPRPASGARATIRRAGPRARDGRYTITRVSLDL